MSSCCHGIHPPRRLPRSPWIQGDITVFDDCRKAVQGMDAIQHLAAQPWPVDHPTPRGPLAVMQGCIELRAVRDAHRCMAE